MKFKPAVDMLSQVVGACDEVSIYIPVIFVIVVHAKHILTQCNSVQTFDFHKHFTLYTLIKGSYNPKIPLIGTDKYALIPE